MAWRRYWTGLLATLGFIGVTIAGLIWVVDPYQNLLVSPSLKRAPAASNQRYAYPAIARDPSFDSLVVGTSTMRLLRPQRLNDAFGGKFANLAMNSGTAYEQRQIAELFARNHDSVRTLIVGIDTVWCDISESPPKFTHRRFPAWMYDANPWNDIPHLLEFKTFEVMGRQLGFLLGLREARYSRDGYRRFVPPQDEYDLARARQQLYGADAGTKEPVAESAAGPFPAPTFGTHAELRQLLGAFAGSTRKVLVFVPYHANHQPKRGTKAANTWSACKDRISAIASDTPNTTVVDFMIPSQITIRDENYWDPLHYTEGVANRLTGLLASAANGTSSQDGTYRILARSQRER